MHIVKNEHNSLGLNQESVRRCSSCLTPNPDKGRAFDGRRAYRCKCCSNVWSEGMQGRKKTFSIQRYGFQFADSKGIGHVA